ncbi:Beta-1,6-glucan boisynthesis protein (Knh1), putative [Penicillium digitatum PHI26]|uniref:Beta-1,6-glucan boisynthesis protein (Knh1), putative n=2 Tax=Penicillium digitatum TaxID=36651 RepID=K9FQL5_PEND2|nr:Beta-1,6-glucan boisynthesis protein (Knh1), putative [Penicillium digitatum Pd1]EKV10707.1 Beta-1,6-glucan boisynthesis protein (Knh1), putative [Penicillium digitatum PHI26]EKV20623.1 Beta-1,6-glucan boisynthesis protein (Knh1), putative [Penicillium digitatum Pd1]
MKGSFSTKVADAINSMQPIPAIVIPWSTVKDDDHLIEAAKLTSTFHISSLTKSSSTGAALQFPTPTKGEAEHNELRKRQIAAAGGVVDGIVVVDQHTVPYGEQTGSIKYAPMPKSAGTTVATRSATPQYPPFPFSIATTYLGAPTVLYTDTAFATWTANTIENTVSLILECLMSGFEH